MIKVIVYAGIFFSIMLSFIGAYNWAKNIGRAECKAEYQTSLQDMQNKAYKAIKNVEDGYVNASKKIRQIPSGSCVGNASRYSIEWLRSNYTGE